MADTILTRYCNIDGQYRYDYIYSIYDEPHNNEDFSLHNHNDKYEIFLFIAGDAEFHIEGNIYQSHPHDIYISRPFEFHHNYFLSPERYERIVINISLDFFRENNCPELEQIFLNRQAGFACQIPAHITNREMFHLLIKMNHYIQAKAYGIAHCVLLEFLYLLNHIEEPLTEPTVEDERVRGILDFINLHLTEPISLDQLSGHFFINKYYLCRYFKSVTGYTINQYINSKRLLLARELVHNGQTLLESSINAGFNSYAHFYKMYRKKFHSAPRGILKDMVRP